MGLQHGRVPSHVPQQMLGANPRAAHSHLWPLQVAAAISVVLEGTVTMASMQGIEDAIEACTHQRWGFGCLLPIHCPPLCSIDARLLL